MLSVIPQNIPHVLTSVNQWVCWKFEDRNDKPSKVPVDPISRGRASSINRQTWTTCKLALERMRRDCLPGVGFVFSEADEFAGIDLDRVRDQTGSIKPWAASLIAYAASYAEISPSGTGCKIFGRGDIPGGSGLKRELEDGSGIEAYCQGRYFAVTGHRLPGAPGGVCDIQPVIDLLFQKYGNVQKSEVSERRVATAANADRQTLIAKCKRYVSKMPASIAGQSGHSKLYAAACRCFEFGLTDAEALEVLEEFNLRCSPPWSEREIKHKLQDAAKAGVSCR